MSDLNGESLQDWIASELKLAESRYYAAREAQNLEEANYHAGIMDILDGLKRKLTPHGTGD